MNNNQEKSGQLNWSELQQQYLDALSRFNGSTPFHRNDNIFNVKPPFTSSNNFDPFFGIGMTSPYSPSDNPMGFWFNKLANNGQNNLPNNLFDKLFEQSHFYQLIAKQFASLTEGFNKVDVDSRAFNATLDDKLKALQALLIKSFENMSANNFADFGLSSLQTTPFFSATQTEMKKMYDQYLSIPGIGQNRETQEKLQNLVKLAGTYKAHENEKQLEMFKLSIASVELMREEIIRMSQQGETFNSARQLYDFWIESSEKVYSDFVRTDKYAELNGKVTNSKMAYLELQHEINDDVLKAMNMPTSKALNELERRHYQLNKKVKVLEKELAALKQQKATLAESSENSREVQTAPKKPQKKRMKKTATAAKKKTVKKKTKKQSAAAASNDNIVELRF